MSTSDVSVILSISEAVATIRDKETLFRNINQKMRQTLGYDMSGIVTVDKSRRYMEIFMQEFSDQLPGKENPPSKIPVSYNPFELSFANPVIKKIVLADLVQNGALPPHFEELRQYGIQELFFVPLVCSGQLIGFLLLVCSQPGRIREEDYDLLTKISNQIAIAVSNTLAYEELMREENEKTRQLAFTTALVSIKNRENLFGALTVELGKLTPCSHVTILVRDDRLQTESATSYLKDADGTFGLVPLPRNRNFSYQSILNCDSVTAKSGVFACADEHLDTLSRQFPYVRLLREKYAITSLLMIMLPVSEASKAAILVAGTLPGGFRERDVNFLKQLYPQIRLVFENLFAFEEIDLLRGQLEQEKNYLLREINTESNGREIIGASPAMTDVLRRVRQVAPIDTTVLIGGETGTGKELIAHALHNLSPRKARPMVKVNCAALPAQLIESELFGHEKGSFTGATERRIGKFELANGGSIFLDEIGELPLELQAKLLRVLQEKEFERIGGKHTLRADVRVIAATNRNLEKEAAAGRFRSDLFFRLDVFPITLPPLRDRTDDIPRFVEYFIERFGKKLGKPAMHVRDKDLRVLLRYEWPGNIRELEHVIERAVIVSNGAYLELTDFVPVRHQETAADLSIQTLEEVERAHIIRALQLTNGQVNGEKGAGKLLGINGKTLGSRMRKLGIRREVIITAKP